MTNEHAVCKTAIKKEERTVHDHEVSQEVLPPRLITNLVNSYEAWGFQFVDRAGASNTHGDNNFKSKSRYSKHKWILAIPLNEVLVKVQRTFYLLKVRRVGRVTVCH